ncbi:hypothetical protein ASF17_05165 [Frigoribacterium sp. Leaf263]|nr:hypothetical protein ASF17_05165 [Frigoribacterium sp. Leaf263]
MGDGVSVMAAASVRSRSRPVAARTASRCRAARDDGSARASSVAARTASTGEASGATAQNGPGER